MLGGASLRSGAEPPEHARRRRCFCRRCARRTDDCTLLVKQRVCGVGGNAVYESHRVKGRRADDADDMVGIVTGR